MRRTALVASAIAAVALAVAVAVLVARSGDHRVAARGHGGEPVIAGLYPDPSVIRRDGAFHLAATSRDWLPAFPLFRSTDLRHWRLEGNVLVRRPRWAAGRFWAPELVPWGRTTRLYYAAERPDRRHCIGLAEARRVAGPYRDLGRPLLCPRAGAIDAAVARDEAGRPYLVYRRWDGAAIVAQHLDATGRRVIGPARVLLTPRPGERDVVEGPEVVRRDGRVFLFFSAAKCCGPSCDYREEVARAPSLLGPYRRAPRPVLRGSTVARCPGHGTVLRRPDGRWAFVYHAVAPDDPLASRRQPMLDAVRWTAAGWPVAGAGGTPTRRSAAPSVPRPRFVRGHPGPGWEWPPDRPAHARRAHGALVLRGDPRTAELARQVPWRSFAGRTTLRRATCDAGLAAVETGIFTGVATGLEVEPGGVVRLWRGRAGPGRTLATRRLGPGPYALTVEVRDGRALTLHARGADARRAVRLTATTSVEREAIRLALTCRGAASSRARFGALRVARG